MSATLALAAVAYLLGHPPPWQLDRLWERHADLKPAKVEDYIAYGLWVGAAFVVLAGTALAVSAPLWARPATENRLALGRDDGVARRRFWLVVGVIVILAGVMRAPRLDHSLWGDEAWAYGDLMGGRFATAEDGSLSYRPHPWKVTLFWDKGLNNQYLFTIAARACNDLWRGVGGAPPHAFSEAALRIIPFIAGLLSIAAVAALLRHFGYSRAAIIAAALLAIHPWHLRYSGEARSYTLLILFVTLATLFLSKAMETDRRRWWAAFALAEFAGLYAWKAAIHPFAALNLIALSLLVIRLRRAALVPVSRCIAANGFALMAFVPLFAPAMPQIALNLQKSEITKRPMDGAWFADVWAQMRAGMDWRRPDPESPFHALGDLLDALPWPAALFASALLPLLAALGLARAFRRHPAAAALLVAPAIGALFAFCHFSLSGTYLLKWYLFYTLPVLVIAIALGLEPPGGKRWKPAVGFLPAAAFAAAYLAIFATQLRALLSHPLSDPRGADQLARGIDQGFGTLVPSDHITVGLYRRVQVYDPRMMQKYDGANIRDRATLERVLRAADAGGKSVCLTVTNIPYARGTAKKHPGFFELVDDTRYFTKLQTFHAIEAYIRIEVYRYNSGSLASSS